GQIDAHTLTSPKSDHSTHCCIRSINRCAPASRRRPQTRPHARHVPLAWRVTRSAPAVSKKAREAARKIPRHVVTGVLVHPVDLGSASYPVDCPRDSRLRLHVLATESDECGGDGRDRQHVIT